MLPRTSPRLFTIALVSGVLAGAQLAPAVPLIALCINVAEWGEMSAIAFQRFSGDKTWLVIGLIQEQMLAQENATMEANMPPPVHDFRVASGRPMFEDFVAALRG